MIEIKKRFISLDQAIKALEKGAADENADPAVRETYAAIAEYLKDYRWLHAHHARVEGEAMRLRAENAALQKQLAQYREALTSSGDTKAAYMGEIKCEYVTSGVHSHFVPWPTIKKIMRMIKGRANREEE